MRSISPNTPLDTGSTVGSAPLKICVSTVTPVYQGEAYLRTLVEELATLRAEWADSRLPLDLIEAIFVDDGSRDRSAEVLRALEREHDWITVVTLAKNFGQHPATIAGILHTAGDWVVTLDEDLQHRPKYILSLLTHAVENGLDVVYAQPQEAVHKSLFRDASSRAYKGALAWLTRNPHIREFNSYRLVRGDVARAAGSVSVHDTYFDMVLSGFTSRMDALPLPLHDERQASGGRTGYSPLSLLSHARRLLISSQVNYLRIGSLIGLLTMLFGLGLGTFKLIQQLVAPETIGERGWTSLFVAITFFGGLAALLIGVLFEYMSTVLLQVQGKPTFYVIDRSKDELLREKLAERAGS